MRKWIIRSRYRRGIWIPGPVELSREAEADIVLAFHAAYHKFNSEVSGLGRVKEKRDSFIVSDIIIPSQNCSGFGTTFDGQELDSIFQELEADKKDQSQYNFWWHSHVKGNAWFSGIDEAMITRRLIVMLSGVHLQFLVRDEEVPEETIAGPFISLVGNIYGEMSVRCDFMHRKESANGIEEHRKYTFTVPLIRPFLSLVEDERDQLLMERAKIIMPLVYGRVQFKEEDNPNPSVSQFRLSDLIRKYRDEDEGEES